MISVVRLHSDKKSAKVWDSVMEHHEEINARLGGSVRMFYATQRVKYGDVSLFVHTDESDALGDFVTEEVSRIDDVDGVWIFSLIQPKFFAIPKETQPNLPRYTLTVHAHPGYLKKIYESLCSVAPTPELVVTYAAYAFRTLGESVLCSVLAKDKKLVNQFRSKHIEHLSGVLQANVTEILNTRRLLPREEWEKYAKIHPRAAGA